MLSVRAGMCAFVSVCMTACVSLCVRVCYVYGRAKEII